MRILSVLVPYPINFDLSFKCLIPRNVTVLGLEAGNRDIFRVYFVTDDSDIVESRFVFLGKPFKIGDILIFPPTWNGALYADRENPLNAQFVGRINDLFVFYQHNINKG